MDFLSSRTFALELDARDELACFRDAFVIHDPACCTWTATRLDASPKHALERVRKKSILLTEYLTWLTDAILAPLGFALGSPRDVERRGSHVSIHHPEGYRINRALIEEMNVIPDNLRLNVT